MNYTPEPVERSLLAFSSEEFCHKILSKTMEKIMASIIDRSRLEQEFELIRQRGYASSIGEVVPEVAGIAARCLIMRIIW